GPSTPSPLPAVSAVPSRSGRTSPLSTGPPPPPTAAASPRPPLLARRVPVRRSATAHSSCRERLLGEFLDRDAPIGFTARLRADLPLAGFHSRARSRVFGDGIPWIVVT